MKKTLNFILMISILTAIVYAEDFDIRKLKWGMPLEEVRKIEKLEDTLYKEETLLGSRTEVVFGIGFNGLEYVIYSTKDMSFLDKVTELLGKKYGSPEEVLDYTFLIDAEKIMRANPEAIIMAIENQDFSGFFSIRQKKGGHETANALKAGLTKRKFWKKGNTAILLLDNVHEVYLSYRSLKIHEKSEGEFKKIVESLKSIVKNRETGKQEKENSNF